MGIMTRLLRLCKADVHGVMDQLEDKRLVLRQHLREMETSLREKEARLNRLTNASRTCKQDMADCSGDINRVEKDLNLAIAKGKDDIAKMLIRKRRTFQTAFDRLNKQADIYNEQLHRLTEILDRQKAHYETLKTRVASLCNPSVSDLLKDSDDVLNPTGANHGLSEEEIELELLQRKEQLQKGGTP